MTPEEKQQLKDLKQVLKTYPAWREWLNSPICVLDFREKQAVKYFLEYKTHDVLARELDFPIEVIVSTFTTALLVIKSSEKNYESWVMNETLKRYQKLKNHNIRIRKILEELHSKPE